MSPPPAFWRAETASAYQKSKAGALCTDVMPWLMGSLLLRVVERTHRVSVALIQRHSSMVSHASRLALALCVAHATSALVVQTSVVSDGEEFSGQRLHGSGSSTEFSHMA